MSVNGDATLPPVEAVADLPAEQVLGFLTQLAALAQTAAARLVTVLAANGTGASEDRLLTVDEAAARLGTSRDWLRRQHALPFRVEVSPGQIRYSAAALERFIARRLGK